MSTAKAEAVEPETLHIDDYDHNDIHQASLADNPETPEMPSWTTLLAIGFLGPSIVAPIACGYIITTSIIYNIGLDLGDTTDLGWVISGWSIASSVSFSLAGSLSDIFGRRFAIMLGQALALVASIIMAPAQNLQALIAGSTLLGFSCGFILVVYAAVPELLPNKYRALGLSYVEGNLMIPWVAIAFLLGNLLLIHATWRWIYYICIIYATISLVGTGVFYFPPPHPQNDQKTRWQQLMGLDYVGILLYAAGLTITLLGLSWGGTAGHAWNSASVIAPIVIGAITFISSFAYDFFWRDPRSQRALFPREMFMKFREFSVNLIVLFVAGSIYYSMSALLPQATEFVYTNDPIKIGVLLLPNGLGQLVCTAFLPMLVHITGYPTRYVQIAVFSQTLFTGLYAYGISGHKAAWAAFQFFGAGPFGLITVLTVFNTGLHVRPSDLGVAVGLLGTFRSMGGSVGIAVFNAILRSVSTTELPRRIAAAALSAGFTGNLAELIPATIETGVGVPYAFTGIAGVTPAIEAAALEGFHQAYAKAFRTVFYSTIPFGVIALVASFFIADSTKYMTNHTHVHLVKEGILFKGHAGRKDVGVGSDETGRYQADGSKFD